MSNRLAICPKRRQLGCRATAQSHCRLCKPHRRALTRSPRRHGRAICQDFETERAGSIFFRLHGTILPPVGVESGLAAYSTGPTQNRTRTSRSRSIEPSQCSCMPLLGLLALSSLIDAAGPSLRPTEQGARSYHRSAAARSWFQKLSSPSQQGALLLHGCAIAPHHSGEICLSCPPLIRVVTS